ncbi:MAG: hypothetical protein HKN82_10270 [Akkermansiaceae bacterium]|nr:hypothetical protein [Akkermansiaceae bacterium]NNM30092.1 hypothetical protein [Akkermansiaceae bacterium]
MGSKGGFDSGKGGLVSDKGGFGTAKSGIAGAKSGFPSDAMAQANQHPRFRSPFIVTTPVHLALKNKFNLR